jgi:hypothetical protein
MNYKKIFTEGLIVACILSIFVFTLYTIYPYYNSAHMIAISTFLIVVLNYILDEYFEFHRIK